MERRRWHRHVVWHLGDVARRAADVPALLDQLHGTKHLLRGNNDRDGTAAAAGWASVGDYAEIEAEGHRLVLCHYPFRSWNGQHRKAINLHGHSHGRLTAQSCDSPLAVSTRRFSRRPIATLWISASNLPDGTVKLTRQLLIERFGDRRFRQLSYAERAVSVAT